MNKKGKTEPYCFKCLKIANNSTIIEIKYFIIGEIKLCYDCINCGIKNLSIKEKLRYHLF